MNLAKGRGRIQRGRKSVTRTLPAPTGGWNAKSPLGGTDPKYAINLVNLYPTETELEIRGGYISHSTGYGAGGKTLMAHIPPGSSGKMFVAKNGSIHDVTASGAPTLSFTHGSNGYWNWVQMGVSGGHFLCAFNGVDSPAFYDGTAWQAVTGVSAPIAITGVTTTTLVAAEVFKRRLFLIPVNSLSFYYLPADAVGGAAVQFTLGPLCRRGGYLAAIGTWTVDAGSGPDDLAVFVTSQGEVIVFQGTDPGSAATWALVGRYDLGARPVGRKCLIKFGSDLLIITTLGIYPLSAALRQGGEALERYSFTNRIEPVFRASAASTFATEGWGANTYSKKSALIVNVPLSTSTYEQYVVNTATKAWCRFTDWNARDFLEFNGSLYFVDGADVRLAWFGFTDNFSGAAAIKTFCQQAFTGFGFSYAKQWKLARLIMLHNSTEVRLSFDLAIDYALAPVLTPETTFLISGSAWPMVWPFIWASALSQQRDWVTPNATPGYVASVVWALNSFGVDVRNVSTEVVFEQAEILI